jgi:transcriptional regulator with XRE-family HTH domain
MSQTCHYVTEAMPLLECGHVPNLKSVRLRRLLTQMELAAASGVSQGTIARIETGERKRVALRTIKALATALEVDPAEVTEFRPSLGLVDRSEESGV